MNQPIVVGIDIGATKICTLIARQDKPGQIRIIGIGIEPSVGGIKKGMIVDLPATAQAIGKSIEKAERTSSMEVSSAIISLAGAQISSWNNTGVVSISGGIIDQNDVFRALEAARAVSIPHNREIIHLIQRGFSVDGQTGIPMPIGMHGYRLEVETHIITAATSSVENLRQCVAASGVEVSQFVLNPLASAEVVLTDNERQMGVIVCDIGGGTTDIAIYINGDVWFSAVIPFGGNQITSDIAHVLRLPLSQAEEIKLQHGHTFAAELSSEEYFNIQPFAEEKPVQINRAELANIIEARVEEIFDFILQEIKRSGYDGLLPAGMVMTGGTSLLPGIKSLAQKILNLPVRLAKPEKLLGMVDKLSSPAFSTSVGLIQWAFLMNEVSPQGNKPKITSVESGISLDWDLVKLWIKRLLP